MRPGFATALLLLLGYGFMAAGGPSLLGALGVAGFGGGAVREHASADASGAGAPGVSPLDDSREDAADGPSPGAPAGSSFLRAALDDHSCHHCVPACFEGRGHVCMGAAPSGGDLVAMDVAAVAGDSAVPGDAPDDPVDRALGGIRIAPRPCRPLDGTPGAASFISLDLRHVVLEPRLAFAEGGREGVTAGADDAPDSWAAPPIAPPPRRA